MKERTRIVEVVGPGNLATLRAIRSLFTAAVKLTRSVSRNGRSVRRLVEMVFTYPITADKGPTTTLFRGFSGFLEVGFRKSSGFP
jgi:hypothetical protein